jgi:curli biogenesis system outer membrane secretion channel CsgG
VSSNAPVNVAVSDLTSSSLAAHEALTLSENLRNVLVESGYFAVISRGDMDSVLKEHSFQRSSACDDTGCLVEMGKLLAAQKMVGGMIGKVGETYSVTLRLVDVQTGRIEAVSTINLKRSPDELLDIIRNAGRALALKYHQANAIPSK